MQLYHKYTRDETFNVLACGGKLTATGTFEGLEGQFVCSKCGVTGLPFTDKKVEDFSQAAIYLEDTDIVVCGLLIPKSQYEAEVREFKKNLKMIKHLHLWSWKH